MFNKKVQGCLCHNGQGGQTDRQTVGQTDRETAGHKDIQQDRQQHRRTDSEVHYSTDQQRLNCLSCENSDTSEETADMIARDTALEQIHPTDIIHNKHNTQRTDNRRKNGLLSK